MNASTPAETDARRANYSSYPQAFPTVSVFSLLNDPQTEAPMGPASTSVPADPGSRNLLELSDEWHGSTKPFTYGSAACPADLTFPIQTDGPGARQNLLELPSGGFNDSTETFTYYDSASTAGSSTEHITHGSATPPAGPSFPSPVEDEPDSRPNLLLEIRPSRSQVLPVGMAPQVVEPVEHDGTSSVRPSPARGRIAATAPGSGTRKGRVFVTEEIKLAMMKLCVENQDMNTRGKKGFPYANNEEQKAYWALISALLEQETGFALRDPQNTHKIIIAARRAQLQREAKESGTVQEETELTQVVDAWLQREADMEEEARLEKDPTAAEKEAEEAEIVRQNLLLPRAQKRTVAEAEVQGNSPPRGSRKSSRSPAKSRGDNEVFLQAMDKLGGSMQDAARVLADSRAQPGRMIEEVDQRLGQLESKLEAQADRHNAAQEQNSHMLTQIMELLQRQQS
ncbi:hypothetical protein EDC01DRAFT_636407 [Geopyxis carbonaria]|nr:hypothetical protein EDC01DRAFT_636407 [Geopyxis carbonaria]